MMHTTHEPARCFLQEVEHYDVGYSRESVESIEQAEQESAWDWLVSVGGDIVKGVTAGAVAGGPVVAVLGGVAGAGLGTLKNLQQPKSDKPVTSPPAEPQPQPQAVVQPTPDDKPSPGPSPNPPTPTAPKPSVSTTGISSELIQQLLQLLPLLSQLQTRKAPPTSDGAVKSESEAAEQYTVGDSAEWVDAGGEQESLLEWIHESENVSYAAESWL
jgi:hypothetical protein